MMSSSFPSPSCPPDLRRLNKGPPNWSDGPPPRMPSVGAPSNIPFEVGHGAAGPFELPRSMLERCCHGPDIFQDDGDNLGVLRSTVLHAPSEDLFSVDLGKPYWLQDEAVVVDDREYSPRTISAFLKLRPFSRSADPVKPYNAA